VTVVVGPLSLGMLFENWKFKNWFYFFGNQFSDLLFFSFLSRKLHKYYQMSDKINAHICLTSWEDW